MSMEVKPRYANWPAERGDPTWLTEARFGLFIHWGLYSLAARHEWVMNREKTRPTKYEEYLNRFDPDLYDPGTWVDAAYNAGMRYAVMTAKHHEGFCLWDSNLTDYKATATAAGRDLVRPYLEALRSRGMRSGLYYSLLDWHHPEFPVDVFHPQRDDEEFKQAAQGRDIAQYRKYLHGQVRELLTDYGTIDYLWCDFSYKDLGWGGKGRDDWGSDELAKLIFELQPEILLNNRLDLGYGVATPEQYQPSSELRDEAGERILWEACQTLNGSWGYDRDNLDWKPVGFLIRLLIDTVAKDGNLLLNVGPTGRGEFDERALDTLAGVGRWMRTHERSIRGAGASPFEAPQDCRYTQRGDRLYLHIFAWPMQRLILPGLAGKVAYAQLLSDASEVLFSDTKPDDSAMHPGMGGPAGSLTLQLQVHQPAVEVPVVELFLKQAAR